MSKQEQLEAVAKDWCMTIRASQIIPVYPLTQDIQPGDIFLVQVPVDQQQAVYKKRGFLPLDNHLARLDPTGYSDFYDHSFPLAEDTRLPYEWMKQAGTAGAWSSAPSAAFPTYSFSVSQGGGMSMAVPVSSVPVAMSLMGTHSANGTVSIKKTRTVGIDIMSLHLELEKWLDAQPERRGFLATFGAAPGEPSCNYLRIVTRVYTTGQLDVQINDARSFSAGVDVGAPKPVNLFEAQAPTGIQDTRKAVTANYERNLAAINAGLAESTSGMPLSHSGDDAGLSPSEIEAKQQKRAEERQARIEEEKKKLEKAQADARSPRQAAATSKAELANKHAERAKIETDIAALEAIVPSPSDKEAKLEALRVKLRTAKTDEASAKQDYSSKAIAAAQSEVGVESARQSLAKFTTMVPGGSIRIAAASARSVAMQETFDPPLTIGYIGFDVPILAGGRFGTPIPTYAVIDQGLNVPLNAQAQVSRRLVDPEIVNSLYNAIKEDQSSEAISLRKRMDGLERFVDPSLEKISVDREQGTFKSETGKFPGSGYSRYANFRSVRERSSIALIWLRDSGQYKVCEPTGVIREATPAEYDELAVLIDQYRASQRELSEFDKTRSDLFRYYQNSGGQ